MYDVFISYTTRGAATTEWIIQFAEALKRYYRLNYSKELRIWYAKDKLEVGDNFQEVEFKAIEQSLVFLMILDPEYLTSPETQKELQKYEEVRRQAGQPANYISVIIWRGNKTAQLTTLVDSNVLLSYFSEYNKDKNEKTFLYSSEEYINEIQNIARGIRKREVDESGKVNSEKIRSILSQPSNVPTIYVTNTNDNWRSPRSQFVTELTKTVAREPGSPGLRILPDFLVSSASGSNLTGEELQDLLSENNEFGERSMEAMLNASSFAVVPFLFDNTNAAEAMLPKIEYQLRTIKKKSRDSGLPVSILSDIPDELQNDARFSDFFDNSQDGKIKVFKKLDINTFIQSYIIEIGGLFKVERVSQAKKVKHVYVVEYFDANEARLGSETDDSRMIRLKEELLNRKKLRKYLVEKDFLLMRNIPVDMDMEKAIRFHKESLVLSDYLIIYRGIREEPYWCSMMQHNTYNIIHGLKEEMDKSIKSAVYVDPLQEVREEEEYNAFGFSVILEDPQQLENFLC